MRDSHRLKEKYELSLDNRQIVSLTVASLVVLGGVFVLGVVVGKKLASEMVPEKPTADLLTAVDQKTAALDAVLQHEKDASLTFQDELTKKFPVEVRLPPAMPTPPAPVAVAEPKKPEAEVEAPKPIAEVAVVAKPSPTKLPDTPKEEPVVTRTHDGGLKEAFGKAQKLPEPAPSPAAAVGTWSLQLSAYQDRAEADRFAAGLRDKGYAPYIIEAQVPGKGTWYRVRVGKFANKEAASNYLNDFKRETSMNGIVAPN